ncbi:ATP synthase F1 subunit epsilon [Mycoplasma zalophidermidis]|uniref:ATP synthase epsilon chain n=1 Tax=Mycoplasma zalophidermidis TaxID=398174 RepID=A0ABS6DSE9_9MOLU|nr:ATP synthase F1 subunit epsilon [Mycoplasma zalophidermidis]MBU4689798.1 ATP synthase F1 subunit epsilon [Mycoplasma zalophidermidis]MBU4693943.1 ATP synthase F1 subunit epsilon [Mycoplasma zalophidermidis]MCR8966577.1 ATP synthase F1 subunit epsilon [Mycoplasma zalophidermidis]
MNQTTEKNNSNQVVRLSISTLEGIFYEGDVRSVNLSTVTGGAIMLQPNRTPFISNIAVGKLSINEPNDPDYKLCVIGGGVVFADSKRIKIITDDIIDSKDIDINRAKRDREEALAHLKETDKDDKAKFELQLRKAIARINISNSNK